MTTLFNSHINNCQNVVNETLAESVGNVELHLVLGTNDICDYQQAYILLTRQKVPGPTNVFNFKRLLDKKKNVDRYLLLLHLKIKHRLKQLSQICPG
jgi:hypothetical protein